MRFLIQPRLTAFATALCGVLLAAACQAQSDAARDSLIAAARKEGKLIIYSGSPRALTDPITQAFDRTYGIAADMLDTRPAEIRERIRSEQSAGRFSGDVTITSAETLKRQAADGVLAPYGAIAGVSRLRSDTPGDGIVLPFSLVEWCLLVNDRLVSAQDEPHSWFDLLDAKWSGKLLMDDPRTNGGGHSVFGATYSKFGRGFHEKLAAQRPVLSPDIALNERRIAQGEYAMYLTQIVANLPRLNGLPVRPVAPSEGLPYGVTGASILKNAPHSNAARLFLDFVLSDEAQEAIAVKGYGSPTGYSSDKVPENLRSLTSRPLLGNAPASEAEALLKLAAEIYH